MAGRTSCGDVLTTQDVFGVGIVVEGRRLPCLHAMAGFTLLAILTLMAFGAVVILLMTGDAFFWRVFVLVEFVAIRALHVHMLAFKRKLGFAVIKTRFFPVFLNVAIATFRPQ